MFRKRLCSEECSGSGSGESYVQEKVMFRGRLCLREGYVQEAVRFRRRLG